MEVHNDQYGLGDEAFAAPEATKPVLGAAPASESAAPPPPSPERPRNPDGTFATVAPASPAPVEHPALLKRLAADLGFTPEEIAAASTADLERDTTQRYAYREQLERDGRGRYREPASASPAEPPPPDPLAGLDWGKAEDGSPLKQDDFAPGLVGIIGQLSARLARLEGHTQSQMQLSLTQRADKVFAQDAEYFGQGEFSDLDPESAEMARRNAAIAVYQADKSKLPLEAKLRKAIAVLRGKPNPKPTAAPSPAPATAPVTPEVWNNGTVAKPTQREGAEEPKSLAKAKKVFMQEMRVRGLDEESYDNEFPG